MWPSISTLKNGRNQGRIYRLAPPGFHSPKPPRLGDATTAELVANLENPNGWWRDTAHRLIHERQDKSCVPALRALLSKSEIPQARLLALWSLQGLGQLSDDDIDAVALRPIGTRFVSMQSVWPNHDSTLRPNSWNVFCLWAMIRMRVFVFSLHSRWAKPRMRTRSVLAGIAKRYASDQWIRTAVLSSVAETADRVFIELLRDAKFAEGPQGIGLLTELAHIVGARGHAPEISRVIVAVAEHDGGTRPRAFRSP